MNFDEWCQANGLSGYIKELLKEKLDCENKFSIYPLPEEPSTWSRLYQELLNQLGSLE